MKKLFLTLACALLALPALARDFSYTYEGQTLTYTVISEEEKTVMTKSCDRSAIRGSLIIPEKVSDSNKEYRVTAIGDNCFEECLNITSISIPNTVTSIGYYAFYFCSGLTSINIPTSVTQMGVGVFRGSGITSITIPNSITEIPTNAFRKCLSLTSITIPNSVTTIGDFAFSGDNSLTELFIPASVYDIGDGFVTECYSLTEINVDKNNPYLCFSESALYNKDRTDLVKCLCSKTGSFQVPSTVTSIRYSAFSDCTELTSITIPNSVSSIGRYAFYNCIGLTSINIPTSLTSISSGMFSDCTGLTSITIPNSVDTIESCAFEDCSSLESIKLPYSLKSIGNNSFYGCESLTSISIPDSVEEIYHGAFHGCSGLKSIYYNTNHPISPKSETSEINNKDVFDDEVYENVTLYVPARVDKICQKIEPWKNFNKIEAYDFSGVDEICIDSENLDGDEIYTLSGVKVMQAKEDLTPGIYIVRNGKEVKKVVVK